MEEKYYPFSGRKEHDFVNEMTLIILRQELIIKDAKQTIERLRATVEEFIESSKTIRKEDEINFQENVDKK